MNWSFLSVSGVVFSPSLAFSLGRCLLSASRNRTRLGTLCAVGVEEQGQILARLLGLSVGKLRAVPPPFSINSIRPLPFLFDKNGVDVGFTQSNSSAAASSSGALSE